jgi:hypothetical protein
MTDHITPPMLDRATAARLLGVPAQFLSNCARRRKGPPFYRMSGKTALYPRAELEQWLAARRVPAENNS